MEEVQVLIVGAGPSGLAAAACLGELGVPYVVVEREDCTVPLWRRRTYHRLKLHLAKEFCELPHMAFPADAPTYVPRGQFIAYVDEYVKRFAIAPRLSTSVESCAYDGGGGRWVVSTRDTASGAAAEYAARFLVLATGENSAGRVPAIPGLDGFPGHVIHSSDYKSGEGYGGRAVLVVGSGNSGFEIAHDLAVHGADTSIVIRSPMHVMKKEMIRLGMTLAEWRLPLKLVDFILMVLAYITFGDLSKYGIKRPKMGPLLLKAKTGRSAVIDAGTTNLIRKGHIKVCGAISSIHGDLVEFEDGKEKYFDSIVLATGYTSTANKCLKNDTSQLKSDGMPKRDFPNHWKGENGLYFVGFARRGLAGIAHDAKVVADDIYAAIVAAESSG